MKAAFFATLSLLVHEAMASISLSPDVQRTVTGSNCSFQWTVTGTITNFTVYNQTTGTSEALNSRGRYTFNNTSKTITLTITSIALSDAGNYSLSIYNGAAWESDSNALLFIFGYVSASLSQTSGRNPAVEGDSVEFTCTSASSSQPAAYRPRLRYVWYPRKFPTYLQVLSNGSLQITNGYIVNGYNAKNDGRTLTIVSVQYDEAQYISCSSSEDGSPYTLSWSSSFYIYVQYKPAVLSTTPPSRKFNAIVGERVLLSVSSLRANPALLAPGSNWTFVSSQGIVLDIPDKSVAGPYTNPSLSFTLTSVSYYGNYSYDMSNAIGTTTVTFQVLPPGAPDAPAAFQVAYATHFSIQLQWNCMWSNFNSRYQYVYTLLREPRSNVTVGASNYTVYGNCYNSTYTLTFVSDIQPDTNYEASVWSINEIGSSSVTRLDVRSADVYRFVVSSDSIRLNGTMAVVNYRLERGNITRFQVTCCYELTVSCTSSVLYTVNNAIGQVSLNIGFLPNGTEYVFDFILYIGNVYTAIAGSVKGIRVSTATGPTTTSGGNSDGTNGLSDLAPAVIALAVLLAVAVFVIAGMLLGFFIWKRRHNFPASQPQELSRSGTSQSRVVEEDQYEEMDQQTRESRIYANLNQ